MSPELSPTLRPERTPPLNVVALGLTEYRDAAELQARVLNARIDGRCADSLLLLEHPPVLTLGKHADRSNIVATVAQLESDGIGVVASTRGGDVTYHGPGQLIAYPIIGIRQLRMGVREYISQLEQCVIQLLSQDYGIADARSSDGFPGVWVGQSKIAAVGVAVRRGVAFHGVALNVNVDLAPFDLIVPCGIPDSGVTSVAQLRGGSVDLASLADRFATHFAQRFGYRAHRTTLGHLTDHLMAKETDDQR